MRDIHDKANRRPVIDPLLLALKSRRVLIALAALMVNLLLMAVPELEPVRGEILSLVTVFALALIGGYTIEDAAAAFRGRDPLPTSTRDQLLALIERLLIALDDANETTDISRTPPELPS